MIKRVIVKNHLDESITFVLPYPERSGLAVSSIEGLGPVAATINTTETAVLDGVVFNSVRLPARNIVFNLFMMWASTIEESRLLTYKYFPVKRKITMYFETENREVEIEGYVESNEPEIFSDMERTTISVVCPDPFFYSVDPNEITFYGVEPKFEFPFSNESLTEPLIEMSEISNSPGRSLIYDGDTDVGMLIDVYASGMVGDLTFYNYATQESLTLLEDKIRSKTGSQISPGDEILISTMKGAKGAILIRNGQEINILNCLDKDSDWIQITKGQNFLSYETPTGSDYLMVKIMNRVAYQGI